MADLKRRIIAEFFAKNKAKGELASFRASLDKTGQAMKRMAKVGAVMATAAAAGLTYLVKGQMDAIDVMAKLSDRLGIATEDLVGLQHAASISGVSQEALNKSLDMFVRRLGEMTLGTGEAKRGLEMLGLTTAELIRLSPAEAMGIAADRINRLETQAEKAAAAYYLFGRAGAQLVTMFAVGSEGLREFQREAEKLGLTFSRFDAAQIEAANDAMTKARASVTGLVRVLTIELAPRIMELADKFTAIVIANEEMVENVIVGSGRIIKALARPIQSLIIMKDLLELSKEIWPEVGRPAPFGGGVPGLGDIPGAREKKLPPVKGLAALARESPLVIAARKYQAILEEQARLKEKLHAEEQQRAKQFANAFLEKTRESAKASVDASLKRIEAEDAAADEIEKVWTEMRLKEEEAAYHAMRAPIIAAEKLEEESAERRKRIAEDIALSMASSWSSAIDQMMFEGKKFWDAMEDMARSLLREITKIIIYRGFAEPMATGIMAWAMPGASAQHGGVFTRPTLVTAGEVPEAFVPLSGGRSIPVEMRGVGGVGGNLDVHIHNEGEEKFEISEVEEYAISDQRIIDVTIRAAGTHGPYRRSIRQASR